MATQFTYPGVYIQEFAPGAPIAGVGTSTPAFIGPAASGPVNTPTKVTSMDQFTAVFGAQPLQGYYLWYAVQGFFDNGGQVCYAVRISNGTYGTLTLSDLVTPTGNDLIGIQARKLGVLNPNIQITVAASSLVTGASIYQASAAAYTVTGPSEITLANAALAAQFRPGDSIQVGTLGDHVIARISGVVFRLADALSGNTAGNIRLSDSMVGDRTFRISASGALLPAGSLTTGTILTITQGLLSDSQTVESVQTEYLQTTPPIVTYRVTFRNGLNIAVNQGSPASVASKEFDLTVTQGTGTTLYAHLSVDPAHPRYYATIINGDPTGQIWANPVEPLPSSVPPKNLPAPVGPAALQNETAEDLTKLAANHYNAGIDSLLQIDDVNLVAVPDAITQASPAAIQQYVIQHCEQTGSRFGVLDGQGGLKSLFGAGSIEAQRATLDSSRGYAALYYPWIRVEPATPGSPILVPPSGHVCGIMARSDAQRGVHKAPANEIVNDAVGLEKIMSDVEQGQLNIEGINIIRSFQGGRPTLWGARTTATDTNWQYVNIRRLFIFLEQSIQQGIRWAVFEPNNTALWAKLKRTITEFLTRVWRDGALFGDTADQAFYVKIDETLNTDTTRALGQLFIQIGVRPSYPAEFIIVRIGIWQGGSDISEG